MEPLFHGGRKVVYASASIGMKPIDAFKEKIKGNMAIASSISGESGQRLDVDAWLPEASKHYCLSKDIRDYVIIPVPAILSDIPNTNGVAMSRNELLAFNTDAGRLAYKTWKGKPCHREHQNQDLSAAKGVLLDAFASPVRGYGKGLIKVMMLASYDRSKDPELANAILNGEENAYSMGAFFEGYKCSVCGSDKGYCKHTDPRTPLKIDPVSRMLAYRSIFGITGFELSSVANPAYVVAISDIILAVN